MVSFGPKSRSLVISDLDELFDCHSQQAYDDAVCDTKLCAAIRAAQAPPLLDLLSTHRCASVRAALAGNKNLTDEIVWKLAFDVSVVVRVQLAGNASLSDFVLESLAEDEDERVAARANKTIHSLKPPLSLQHMILGFFSTNRLRNAG